MENWSRAIEAGRRGAEFHRVHPASDARLAHSACEELFLMGMPRLNVLLGGRDDVVRLVLRTLLSHAEKPIASWFPGEPFSPPPADWTGTLVLHEVGALGIREQIRLLEWSGVGRAQVISSTPAPLLPRVTAGAFIDTLYYRLNTVYLDVTGVEEPLTID